MSTEPMQHDDETGDPEERLRSQIGAASELREKCHFRSATRLSREVHRAATAEKKLIPLLLANFTTMNLARDILEPELGRDAAVENIAFLQSPDRARAFQGDLDEAEYEHTVHWMSSCSYDNLAVATALEHGYNSPGMQACIAEGMDICRRTGKTECITCFREYATSVHRAADDLEMAMQFARANLNRTPDPNNDRRWGGADALSEMLMLSGRFEEAWEIGQQAWGLTSTYHTPMDARRGTALFLSELAHLAQRQDWLAAVPSIDGDQVPPGEDPLFEYDSDTVKAVAVAMAGDPDAAVALLTPWDKRLSDNRNLHTWFDCRLRLIALYLMKDDRARAEALAKPLREKATTAKDYLTLRRLDGMLDGSIPVMPTPLAAAPGARASAGAGAALGAASPATPAPPEQKPFEVSPLIQSIAASIPAKLQAAQESGEPPDLSPEINQLLAAPADTIENASASMHLAGVAVALSAAPPTDAVWVWGQKLVATFPKSGPVLNALARLAEIVRSDEQSPLAQHITTDHIAGWYRQSLDMDANQPNGFARAGDFFLQQGEIAEAERCYARAFRLNRANTEVASNLAQIYRQGERGADALSVLDMCLREGGESPQILWEAGLTAFGLGRWEVTVSYLDRLEEVAPNGRWTQYYRAMALLELGRFADARTAIDQQATLLDEHEGDGEEPPPTRLHVHCIRAATSAAAGDVDAIRQHIDAALAIRLGEIGDLALGGITANLARLHTASAALPAGDPLRDRVHRLMLATGAMPESHFDAARKQLEQASELTHFVVRLKQPLGGGWASHPACLPGQQEWTESLYTYGVLADDETDARGHVLEVHDGLFEDPPEILFVMPQGGPFADHPGVVWQSSPESAEGEEDDSEEDNEDDEEMDTDASDNDD